MVPVVSILTLRFGAGGTDVLRRLLGLTGYTSGTSQKDLSISAVKALQQTDKTLSSGANVETIELEVLPGIAESARRSAEQVVTTLKTTDDQPVDTAWVNQARRELSGLIKAMMGVGDELANSQAKLLSIDV